MPQILIIDDDSSLAAMLDEYLREQGFAVTCAESIEKGLNAFEKSDYDLVLLDVMLPDGNGFDACKEIRKNASVPIIMLTAKGDEMDRVVGLEVGADDYVPKPFSPRELVARIRAVLRRTRRDSTATIMRVGNLEIDLEGRNVYKNGSSVELTSRQFDLFKILVERKGRVQSRDQLMQALSGQEFDTFDRSIDVHISRIRAVIEDDPKKPIYLKSVRGTGYVFAVPDKNA